MTKSASSSIIEYILPIAFVAAILLIAFVTLYPFAATFLWGAILAIAIEPTFKRLTIRLGGRRTLAAWTTGVALMLLFVLPAVGLLRALLRYIPGALAWIESHADSVPDVPPGPFQEIPIIGPQITSLWESAFRDASSLVSRFSAEIKGVLIWTLSEMELLGIFVLEFALGALLAVLLVYHAERLKELSQKFMQRVGGEFAQAMASHSVTTTRQAVRGVLGAALAQTLVATVAYVIAGIPGWIIWSGITFILSLVQIGPTLIWLPMAIWLWAIGQPLMALFVFLWGLIAVNLTDNFVRPYLVSKNTNFPAFLAFLGAIGGLLQWGVVGVFVGPVVVAVCYELVLKWLEPDTLEESAGS